MELLGRDTDLSAEAELTAVGEACRSVDIYRRSIDLVLESAGIVEGLSDDAFRVAGAVFTDMSDSLADIVNDLDSDDKVVEFSSVLVLGSLFDAVRIAIVLSQP